MRQPRSVLQILASCSPFFQKLVSLRHPNACCGSRRSNRSGVRISPGPPEFKGFTQTPNPHCGSPIRRSRSARVMEPDHCHSLCLRAIINEEHCRRLISNTAFPFYTASKWLFTITAVTFHVCRLLLNSRAPGWLFLVVHQMRIPRCRTVCSRRRRP